MRIQAFWSAVVVSRAERTRGVPCSAIPSRRARAGEGSGTGMLVSYAPMPGLLLRSRDGRCIGLPAGRLNHAMRQISGMSILITGASSGIGAALAHELGRRGARLVLAARRLDRLETLNQELGGGHLCHRADVAEEEDCRRLVGVACERYGRLDTLVCNAGFGLVKSCWETSQAEELELLRTNLLGTSACIRAALPRLRTQEPRGGWRGQVMVVSSSLARRALPGYGIYSASKAAQLSLAEALRLEVRTERIAVTSVHPVGTRTEFFSVAGSRSGALVRNPGPQQEAAVVARAMVRAMARPRPEVWPYAPVRWLLPWAQLFPGLSDRLLARVLRR